MRAWRLFRHLYADGSSKDWAVKTNPDGSITTRWGKTAVRLPSISTRHGIRQFEIEREKQAKGYVFVSEVDMGDEGQVFFPGTPMPKPPTPPMTDLYWHVECEDNLQSKSALRDALATLSQSLSAQRVLRWPNPPLFAVPGSVGRLTFSGQLTQANGLMPCLLLMAVKHKALPGVDIGIATNNSREVTADLKAEADILDFFGTDVDSIRPLAENLGLLTPRLNLADLMPDTQNGWF